MTGDPYAAGDALMRIRAAVEDMERRSRASQARDAGRSAELAEAARRGDLGPQWRAVQRRVDRGETTLADVFAGRDGSPEAAALAERARSNLTELVAPALEDDAVAEATEELAAVRARALRVPVEPARGQQEPGVEPPLPPSVAWDPRS